MDSRNGSKHSAVSRIRILSLGNSGVGKSCLIKRYCEKRFVNKYVPTVGIDYGSTTVDVDGRKVSVHFFDTSGSPLFEEVRTEFYRDMQGILLTYDVTDRLSFIALDAWLSELRHNLGTSSDDWGVAVIVCGTRTDTGGSVGGRQISETEGRGWADRHHFPHVLTSAALGTGINHAFHTLFVKALQLKDGTRGSSVGSGGSMGGSSFSGSSFGGGSKSGSSMGGSSMGGSSMGGSSMGGSSMGGGSKSGSSMGGSSMGGSSMGGSSMGGGSKSGSSMGGGSRSGSSMGGGSRSGSSMGGSSMGGESKSGSSMGGGSKSGSEPPPPPREVDPEVIQAIRRLTHASNDHDKMGLTGNRRTMSKDEINKSYRRLAALVHPDKCKASGAEDAFKALTQARNNLLKYLTETTV